MTRAMYEIIVADNESTEDILAVAEKYNCRYLYAPGTGSYTARNQGIQHAKGKYLGFTDSDCIPDAFWIEQAVEVLSKHHTLIAIGGNIQMFFEGKIPSSLEWYEYHYAFIQKNNITHRKYAVTANLWAPYELFKDCGTFNNELISGGDLQWGKRLHQHGYRMIYAPDCVVYHSCRTSLQQTYRKIYRIQTGQLTLNREKQIPLHARPFVLKTIWRTSRPPIRQIAKWLSSSELKWSVPLKLSWASVLIACTYSVVIIQLAPQIIANSFSRTDG